MGSIHGVEAFPLYWPEGWARHVGQRKAGRYQVSFATARDETVRELKAMGASDILISSCIPLRRDGLPVAFSSEPADVGVAVYWTHRVNGAVQHRVMACDCWATTRANLRAINLSIAALRTLDRAGATQILDRMYRGLSALPASTSRPWRVVFGLDHTIAPTKSELAGLFAKLAAKRHPDVIGGSHETFVELNTAFEQAKKELGFV